MGIRTRFGVRIAAIKGNRSLSMELLTCLEAASNVSRSKRDQNVCQEYHVHRKVEVEDGFLFRDLGFRV